MIYPVSIGKYLTSINLLEIKRITKSSEIILLDLSKRIGLNICQKSFAKVIDKLIIQTWTRDPFDRIIVAQAALDESLLLTKDNTIIANYGFSRW